MQEANRQLKAELLEALDSTVTEQLNSMFNELLDKMADSESRWHEAIKKLSEEMKCKVDKIEFDSLKKKLTDEWEKIYQRLQAQEAPEITDAAGLKTELKTRFHHLSCDQPVAKNTPGPQLVNLPDMPGFPSRRYTGHIRAFDLCRLRQHSNNPTGGSKQVANPGERMKQHQENPKYMTIARSCGGSHTITSARQRHPKTPLHTMTTQRPESIGIIGQDGRVYRGCAPSTQSTKDNLNPDRLQVVSKEAERTRESSKTTKPKCGDASKTNTKGDCGANPAGAEESLLMVKVHSLKQPPLPPIAKWRHTPNQSIQRQPS